MSAFDAECPKCHGKGIPKPVAAPPQLPAPLPYNPTIPRPAPAPPQRGMSPVAIGALVLVPVVAVFAAFNFFGLEVKPKSPNAPTAVATSVPTVAPVVTPAPIAPSGAPTASGRTMVSERDAAWIEGVLPIMKEAALAERKFLNSRGKTPSESVENLTELKASMEQVRLKLLGAPRSANFAKASSLFFEGVNKTATGADLVLIGYAFKDAPSGQDSIKDGGEQLIAGGNLMESGLKAAGETMDELGVGK